MTPRLAPYRRDVHRRACTEAPVRPMPGQLALTAGFADWDVKFRLGHCEIGEAFFLLVARAMQAGPEAGVAGS